jgi:hypothetical protein
MRKLRTRPWVAFLASILFLSAASTLFAQAPANETHCPSTTAIPPYVGSGSPPFSRNQNLCLPELAPIGGPMGVVAFIVRGVEPGDHVDSQGTIYVDSI